ERRELARTIHMIDIGLDRQEPARQHRHERHRDQQRAEEGEYDDQRELLEQGAGGRPHERDGQKDHASRQRRCDDRAGHLFRADQRALFSCRAALALPHDVLEDDDRVVDDHADAERDAAEAHLVQRKAAEVDEAERRDDRDRDRNRDDQRRRRVAQEREQDNDGQDSAPDRGVADAVDRALDERALVGDDLQLEVVTELVDPLHLGADRRRYGDCVRTGLLPDAETDRRYAAHFDVAADLAERELHVRDVLDPDRRAVDDRDDRVRDLVDVRKLAERSDVQILETFADVASRKGHVLAADRVHDVGGRQLHRDQPVADQVDVDLAIDASPDLDRADARDLLEAAHQVLLENPRQILERQRRARADHDDRLLVRVELANLRRIDLGGKRLTHAVERRAHVIRRRVEVRALREAKLDLGEAFARPRADSLEIRNTGDRVLDPFGNDQLHLFRADVSVAHPDAELRKLDRRKQI